MYSKYGKCKTRKTSKSPTESEKSEKPGETADETSGTTTGETSDKAADGTPGKTSGKITDETTGETAEGGNPKSDSVEDEEVGEEVEEEGPYRKGSSQKGDPDEAGLPNTDSTKGSDEKYAEFEGGESGSGADEEEDSSEQDDDEMAEEESTDGAEKKKRKKVKAVMEYDIKDMYPEINILIQKKKREWDYQDPDIIRALWLETKTLALSEWKVRNAKISISKPSFEVKETVTVTLRQEHLKNKAELQQALQERDFEMTEASRDPPHFDTIQLATNLTTDMRYKYNRNNPPVPSHYIEHFEKYKKPPFKNYNIRHCHSQLW